MEKVTTCVQLAACRTRLHRSNLSNTFCCWTEHHSILSLASPLPHRNDFRHQQLGQMQLQYQVFLPLQHCIQAARSRPQIFCTSAAAINFALLPTLQLLSFWCSDRRWLPDSAMTGQTTSSVRSSDNKSFADVGRVNLFSSAVKTFSS